jgi:photosynthetic reaction center L subunit
MLAFEARYRDSVLSEVKPIWWLGLGVFRFWIGRFYVGFWGLSLILSGLIGGGFWFYRVVLRDLATQRNPLVAVIRGTVETPSPEIGLRFTFDPNKGFYWQMIVILATIAFISWMMRQVDISRNLKMGYQVPIAYGAVVSSWVTIQVVRPILLGHWSEGFPLGIMSHLDWVSTFGYRFWNFFYNPFHALGIAFLFGSAFILGLHGATILSGSGLRSKGVTEDNINTFYWDFFGYSIGEVGVHRLALYFAVFCVLLANVCLLASGTIIQDWSAFWAFWGKFPLWKVYGYQLGG